MPLLIAILMSALFAWPAVAVEVLNDPGPPYTSEQFLEISKHRISSEQMKKTLPSWWAKCPQYLRDRILSIHSTRWLAVIICNIQGHSGSGRYGPEAIACEDEYVRQQARGSEMWTKDGQWVGPSEACRARNKRSQWGELICD